MTPAGYSRVFAAALMSAAFTSAAMAGDDLTAAGVHGNDGIYAVYVTTRAGDCDKLYDWTILVSGGRVSSAGDTPMEASGQINPRGLVNLQFERLGQVANVTGRVAMGAGSGTWTSPTMNCSGSWRATKRGWADR
ncbi:MAG: hypothetical protein L0Y60_13375 [Beijerinckiaceae bacterium]|nr:hypothetical protein [Beijerinckiaceae bacterium]